MGEPKSGEELQPIPHLETGIWEHFKGGRYLVLGVCRSSENLNTFAVHYFSLAKGHWLVRRYKSPEDLPDDKRSGFTDTVSRPGYEGPRFRPVRATAEELTTAIKAALPASWALYLSPAAKGELFGGQGQGPYLGGY